MKKLTNTFQLRALRVLAVSFSLLLSFMTIRAQTVTIGGGASGTCPFLPMATYTPAISGVTFSNWSRGSGVTCASAGNGLSGNGFNTGSYSASFSANKYYSITISAGASTPFILTQAVWNTAVSSGTANFTIEYSNNGGPLTVFGAAAQTNTTSNTFSGSVSVIAGTSIILYFIPSGTGAAGTTVRLVNGSTITVNTGAPASTDWFRSTVSSGDWSSFLSWESSPDGVTWFPAIQAPTNAAHSIEIQNGHTIAITSAQTAKLLTIDPGGVLTHAAGFGLTITDDGTSATDFAINGRYELNGTMPTYSVGTEKVVVSNGAEVRVNDNTPPNTTSDDFARDTHVYFNTGSLFSWYYAGVSTFTTTGVTYFPNATATDKAIFRVCVNVGGTVGGGSATIFNCKFEVASGVTLTMQNAGTKTFRDGLGGAGILIHSITCGPFQITSATAVIDGSLTVEISHSTGNDLIIPSGANVTMGGTATINFGKSPYTQASMLVDGTFTSNGNFTFKSDVNGTARVAVSTGTFNGDVVYETYISSRRSWRLLSVPTSGSQTIRQAWQENANQTLIWPNVDPVPGYGMHITGTVGSLGCDPGPQPNASVKKWNLNNGWNPLMSTFDVLSNEPGYFVFVRGPRSTDMRQAINASTATTTLRSKGTIVVGPTSVTVTSSVSAGYVLIPNKYMSPMSLTGLISGPNMNSSEYARWNHLNAGSNGVGSWVNVNGSTISNMAPPFTDLAHTSNLQIGESFIGRLATGMTSATISYTEAMKGTTEFLVFRPTPVTVPEVHVQLDALTDTSNYNVDGFAVQFGIFEHKHSLKFTNQGENIFVRIPEGAVAIESKEMVALRQDSSEVEMSRLKTGQRYSIKVTANSPFKDSMQLFFVDRATPNVFPITEDFSYEFTADSVGSKHRFMLIYRPVPKVTPPVLQIENTLTAGPNPVSGILSVSGVKGFVRITNTLGVVVYTIKTSEQQLNVDCSPLKTGLYYLSSGGQTKPISFIKQ